MNITYANDEQGTVTIKFTKEETEQIYQNAVYNLKHNNYKQKKKKKCTQVKDVFVPPSQQEYYEALTAKYAKCVAYCNDLDFEQTKQYLCDKDMLSPQFAIYPDFKNQKLSQEELFKHIRTVQDPVCACNTALYWHMLNKYYRRKECDPVWNYINNRFY